MARSLNRVQLIGNLTRDPELRYTPNGTAVCTFGLATNRAWKTESGEKHEEADFHRIVAWNKLAEICSQFLTKGRKTYVEGRLSTRNWTAQDGTQKTTTEIVISDMILLDSNRRREQEIGNGENNLGEKAEEKSPSAKASEDKEEIKAKKEKEKKEEKKSPEEVSEEEVAPDDIPF